MSYSRALPFAKTGNNSKIWIIALVMMVMCLLNHSKGFAEAVDCQIKGLYNCAACKPNNLLCEADEGFTDVDLVDYASNYNEYDSSNYSDDDTGSFGQSGVGVMTANTRALNAPLIMNCEIQSV